MRSLKPVWIPLVLVLLASPARAVVRSDSTVADTWRLENGLEVRTLHVPKAGGVSVTLAFRAGSGYEPAHMVGLSALLAELQFMSAAGDVPARTREEMQSLRPLGWDVQVGSRLARFTEIASPAQLPGVLQQAGRRLAGVTLTDADLKVALASVRRDAASHLFGLTSDVLYWRAGLLARGMDDEQIVECASLKDLDKIKLKDIPPLLARWYNPGNASLAIAGDLTGLDVRALVKSVFAPLPGGPAMPDTVQVRLRGGKHTAVWKDLTAPIGVIAVEGPALSDTLHPAFYLSMLLTGSGLIDAWGAPKPPLVARFQYSLFDEPELVRFYPPVKADATDPDVIGSTFTWQLQELGGRIVDMRIMDVLRRSVRWLLGGELSSGVLANLDRNPGGLASVTSGLATRALWKGDAFWAGYLRRFDKLKIGHNYYYEWMEDAKHQTALLLTPAR